MVQQVSVAVMKSRLSELMAQVAFTGKQIVITRRQRPMAALVSMETLQVAQRAVAAQGVLAAAKKLRHGAALARHTETGYRARRRGRARRVSL